MWTRTRAADLIGTRLPIVVAPMGGGPSTPELVAAAGEAGALGSLASGYLDPEAGRDAIRRVRALTGRPFAVNLFVGPRAGPGPDAARFVARLAPFYAGLGLAPPPVADRYGEDLAAQLTVVLDERVPVVSFTFGIPPADALTALRQAGTAVIGTATCVTEAVALADAGVDAVCAQGAEAGAHRGSFTADGDTGRIGTVALVPQVADATGLPVLAAGGIMDGRGIAAALSLGADAVQMGTAFMRCPEAGTHAAHRRALAAAGDTATTVTRAFTGRSARAIRNRYVDEMDAESVPDYPVAHHLTAPLRAHAARAGDPGLLALWAGQGASLGRELPAAALISALESETTHVLRRAAGLG
jgi:nitronate monooxygenase